MGDLTGMKMVLDVPKPGIRPGRGKTTVDGHKYEAQGQPCHTGNEVRCCNALCDQLAFCSHHCR